MLKSFSKMFADDVKIIANANHYTDIEQDLNMGKKMVAKIQYICQNARHCIFEE